MSIEPKHLRKRGRPRTPGVEDRLIEAYRELVVDVGIVRASMTAVCDRIGIGKPTAYLRFRNVADLHERAYAEALDALAPDQRERLKELVKGLHDFQYDVPNGAFLIQSVAEDARILSP